MRILILALVLVAGCGRDAAGASTQQQPLTSTSSQPLAGCFEAPQGDDNRNIYRFEKNGNAFYLDTWNRGAGLPTTKLSYQLQGGLLSFDGGAPFKVEVLADALVFPDAAQRWPAVDCAEFNW
jgi:hypothetical protein